MGNNGFRNTYGQAGAKWGHPTITTTSELTAAPRLNMSPNAGNLEFVDAAGTITATLTTGSWDIIPSVGDKVLIDGTTNYDGVQTLTAVTQSSITFTDTSAGNQTISSAEDAVSVLYTPVKHYQDVAFTSGIPNSGSVVFGNTLTVKALGGVYSYVSAYNSTSTDLTIQVAGGNLVCPAGASLGQEIRPFTSDVVCNATAATLGKIIINIS